MVVFPALVGFGFNYSNPIAIVFGEWFLKILNLEVFFGGILRLVFRGSEFVGIC